MAPALLGGLAGDAEPGADLGPGVAELPQTGHGLADSRIDLGGQAEELASLIPGAQALPIPRRDHMLAVGDRVYKEGVLAFLQKRP